MELQGSSILYIFVVHKVTHCPLSHCFFSVLIFFLIFLLEIAVTIRKIKNIREDCSTAPSSLPPSYCCCWFDHGNLTNNGNDWRDGGYTEEDRKWRTGNHVLEEREEKRGETQRRLWSGCRNCGIKIWRLAMQLKVIVNRRIWLLQQESFFVVFFYIFSLNNNLKKHKNANCTEAVSDAVTSSDLHGSYD